jgi:hypothetical protein
MSTNYYIKCSCCKQEITHLGKISNNTFISNYTKKELKDRIIHINHWEYIEDEYGKTFLPDEFLLEEIPYEFVLQKGNFR